MVITNGVYLLVNPLTSPDPTLWTMGEVDRTAVVLTRHTVFVDPEWDRSENFLKECPLAQRSMDWHWFYTFVGLLVVGEETKRTRIFRFLGSCQRWSSPPKNWDLLTAYRPTPSRPGGIKQSPSWQKGRVCLTIGSKFTTAVVLL